MLDVKPLRYFITLAETQNFHRAAERLHLSQPSLSRHIAALERAVGARLVDRTTRQLALTPAGEGFYAEAKEILAALNRAQTRARETAQGIGGTLRIGFTMYSVHTVVPRYVQLIRSSLPLVALELEETVSDELPDKVMAGDVDIAVLLESTPRAGMLTAAALTEPLCVALSRGHPKARARAIGIADLKDDPFVMTSSSAGGKLNAVIMDFCRRHGFEPQVSFQVRLQQTMLSLVNDASYVALVPNSMRQLKMDGIVFKTLLDAPAVSLEIAWNANNDNPCLKRFLQLIHSQTAG